MFYYITFIKLILCVMWKFNDFLYYCEDTKPDRCMPKNCLT